MAEKQHYVPEVYLKHFVNKDQHFFSSTARLEHYNKPKLKHPSQVCYLPDFYQITATENPSLKNFIERKAFSYENKELTRIFKSLMSKSPFITKSNHRKLIEIYLSIKHRNLYVREFFKPTNLPHLLDREAEKFRPLKETLEQMTKRPFDELMGKVKEGILNDEGFAERSHHQALLKHAAGVNEHANQAKKVIMKLKIHVLEPQSKDDYFITSDNPGFTIVDTIKVFNTNFDRFDAIGFPISSRHLLFLTNQSNSHSLEIKRPIHYLKLPSKYVFEFNESTTFNSLSHVFCCNQEFLDSFTKSFRAKHNI